MNTEQDLSSNGGRLTTDQPTHEGWWTHAGIPDQISMWVIIRNGDFWFHGFSGLFECDKFSGWTECRFK